MIGGRQVQMEDRRNLPFTDAVIHETLRLACILPMALPHRTSQDVTFQGHFIPKVRLHQSRPEIRSLNPLSLALRPLTLTFTLTFTLMTNPLTFTLTFTPTLLG